MSLVRLIAQRIALGFVAAWSVLSLVFALFTLPEDYYLDRMIAMAHFGGADMDEIERMRDQYLAQRGRGRPVFEQYIDWLTSMFTLDWGQSFETGEEVLPAVQSATITTGSYVIPALLFAIVIALLVGIYSTMRSGSYSEGGLRTAVYFLLGLPNFWLGGIALATSSTVALSLQWRSQTQIRPEELPFFYDTVVPALLVTTTLVAAIASYARAYTSQYARADLTKLVRAKGGGQIAVARHVVRNAAIPLVSLVFTETIALLAIAVFVIEALFTIDGLGLIFYNAVWTRDMPMLLGGTMVVVAVGVVGNIVQDIAYTVLDPRVDTGTR